MSAVRTTLTKSLHTVSAVSAIAVHLLTSHDYGAPKTPISAVREALRMLGQPNGWPDTDPTFAACVAKVNAMRGAK